MKIRTGFVSNSSSSSFVCDVCGYETSGWNMGMDEAGMVKCEKGHMFCESHLDNEIKQGLINKHLEYMRKTNPEATVDDVPYYATDEWVYNINAKHCPICTKEVIPEEDLLAYLVKKSGMTLDEIKQEFREQCC